jgi:ribose transport system permease protein
MKTDQARLAGAASDETPAAVSPALTRPAPRARSLLTANGVWAALVVLALILATASASFRAMANIQNILNQNAVIGIVACGMLVMMISGGFDLSVGAVGAAASVAAAWISVSTGSLTLGMLAAVAVGLTVGLVNGLIITLAGINPFITTFAMASVISGILFVLTSAQSQTANAAWLATIAFKTVAGVPLAFLVFLFVALLTHLLLTRTKWGHWLYSIGANANASYLSGVPVSATRIAAFIFGGLTAALASLLLLGQTNIGQPTAAADWPLNAIAICIIGGTALSGGVGRVGHTVAATLLLGVVANGLNQLAVSPYWQPAVTGLIILIAVGVEAFTRRRGGERLAA